MLTTETIREAPKALLHDHLDGGLRPATVIDLAREYGYADLPTEDVDELSAWFRRGADRKSLELYLETFQHTFGVMQHYDAIVRVRRRQAVVPELGRQLDDRRGPQPAVEVVVEQRLRRLADRVGPEHRPSRSMAPIVAR